MKTLTPCLTSLENHADTIEKRAIVYWIIHVAKKNAIQKLALCKHIMECYIPVVMVVTLNKPRFHIIIQADNTIHQSGNIPHISAPIFNITPVSSQPTLTNLCHPPCQARRVVPTRISQRVRTAVCTCSPP